MRHDKRMADPTLEGGDGGAHPTPWPSAETTIGMSWATLRPEIRRRRRHIA